MTVGPLEIGLVVLVIVLLFGAKKLPDLARSMGRSMRIFKSEVKEMKEENNTDAQGQIAASKKSDEDFWNSPEMQPRSSKTVDGTQN